MYRRPLIVISTVAMLLAIVQSVVSFPSFGLCSSASSSDNDNDSSLRGPSQHVLRVNSNKYTSNHKGNNESMLDVLRKDRRFTKLVEAVSRAGGNLRNDLEQEGQEKTLMAPTNDAFDTMERTLRMRIEDMSQQDISKLIRYHIIPDDAYTKNDLKNGELLKTAMDNHKPLGDRPQIIRVYKEGQRVLLNMYSQIIDSDIQASNGVVHAVSDVLRLPRPLFETLTLIPSEFSTQALALQLTGLEDKVDKSSKVTALVATNAAWETLGIFELMSLFAPEGRHRLKRILQKHYVPNVNYIREIASKEGITEKECLRLYKNNNDLYHHGGRSITRELNTWADEKVTLRITCRGGEMKAMIDESSISLQDLPADNGVAHLLSTPLVLNERQRRPNDLGDNDDEDEDEDEDEENQDDLSDLRRRRHHRRRFYY